MAPWCGSSPGGAAGAGRQPGRGRHRPRRGRAAGRRRDHPEGAKAAAAGAAVVYHCAQPPYTDWPAAFPPLTEAVAEGAAAAGAKLVLADNLYLYGPHAGPLTEDLPAAATGPKGRVRAQMAERLLALHREGRLRVALGRASNYYGPGGLNSVTGERLFRAAVAGRTVRWVGRLDQPHTLSYLEDVAAGLATLGADDRADGQAWHLPAAEPSPAASSWSWWSRPAAAAPGSPPARPP